jgi:hypothetical protein
MNILLIFFFFLSLNLAQAEPVFVSITYYDGLGQKFRVETASAWPKCQESKRARKVILDAPNELREITLWRADGKMEEGGANNKPALLEEVEAIFAGAKDGENPCLKSTEQGSEGAKASLQ